MTQEPASNDYKHLERDVKALDFSLWHWPLMWLLRWGE